MKLRTATVSALTAGSIATAAAAATPSDQLVMAWNVDAISTFDPAEIGELVTSELISNTCDTLVLHSQEEESQIVPGLAESWDISDDGQTITFHLREDAQHSSGNPVTAEDVVWTMKRTLELGLRNASSMEEYGFTTDNMDEAFKALDDKTFQLTLQAPYPPELILLAVVANRMSMPLDRELLQKEAQDGDMGNTYLKTHTACAGPYRLRQWNAGEVVVLEANENYWGGTPEMRRVIIRHIPEPGAQRLLLERGDIDVARDLVAADLPDFEENPDIWVKSIRKHQLQYMAFNTAREPFDDPQVIEALRYLIDYDRLEETVMNGLGEQRNVVVPNGSFGALGKDEGAPYSLDLDKAQELLSDAGFEDGFEATIYLATDPISAPLAQHMAANASEIGVELNIEQMASSDLFSRYRGRNFDAVMSSWNTPLPDANGLVSKFVINPDNSEEAGLSNFPTWRASWVNEEFNRIAEEALTEKDTDKRAQMYRDLQREHMTASPFIFMFQLNQNIALREEVTAFPAHALRAFYNGVKK